MKKVIVIAEAGVNHNGDLERAFKLVDAAAAAGSDYVKFQSFKAEKLVTKNADKADYQKKMTGSSELQFEMLRKLELSRDDHFRLVKHCKKMNIKFLSTPFDEESLKMLVDEMDLPFVKIPSGEITNGPYLINAAKTGLPLVVSTGMCTLNEVIESLGVIAWSYLNKGSNSPQRSDFVACFNSSAGKQVLKEKVTVLHCTTEYPTPFSEVNLSAIQSMREQLGVPIGYSDHTMGITVPIAAVALGATLIEKHFTLDRNLPGPDHKASLEPDELIAMMKAIREVEQSMGDGIKKPTASEIRNMAAGRKSIVAAREIKKGSSFTVDDLSMKRPGTGRSAMEYWDVIDKPAKKNYKKDELID